EDIDLEIIFNSLVGTNYHLMGNYDRAQPYYLEGIKLLENKQEKKTDDLDNLAKLYYNTGLLYTNLRNKENSLRYMEKALELYLRLNSKSGLARCYNALGHHHPDAQDNPSVSIEYYTTAAKYFEEDNDLVGLATAYNNIGFKYGMVKDIERANYYLEQSIKIRKALGNKRGIAASYFFKGIVMQNNGFADKALEYFLTAEQLLIEVNSKHELHSLYEQMSKCYAYLKRYKEAFICHKKFSALKKEIFSFDYNTTLNLETSRLLIELKEKEAEMEWQKQKELSEYIIKLENAQKELVQMVYITSHDLREPVRMIKSYSLLLLKHEVSSYAHAIISEITAAADKMWNTIKELQKSAQRKVLVKQ
ncbi:MAG: hypothetical protein NZ522_07395, partial [Chitinophagales bacterium]|nr:hypothetical protein [Chitinophagales bacterium]